MTILKKVLVFNAPRKEQKCIQCNGTGIYKGPRISGGNIGFCIVTIFILFMTITKLFSYNPNYFIDLPFFILSAIVSIMILIEYNKQTRGEA